MAQEADFLVIGAHALAAHGLPRSTGDLDIWIRPTPDNARRVWRALANFGAPLEDLQISEEDLALPAQVCQIGLPPRRIDVLTRVSGVEFEDAWETRLLAVIEEIPVAFLGRAALIKNKRASARPKDLADIDALENQG